MDEGLKKRLIGAAVLASLAVIFVPMLFEEPPSRPAPLPPLPPKPAARDFAAEMLRDPVPEVAPLAPRPVEPVGPPASTGAAAPAASDAPAASGPSAWVVQAASLSSSQRADQLVARLREANLPTPDAELVEIRGKRYYRVQVGPVIERAQAEEMVDRIKAIAGTEPQVRRYP